MSALSTSFRCRELLCFRHVSVDPDPGARPSTEATLETPGEAKEERLHRTIVKDGFFLEHSYLLSHTHVPSTGPRTV